MDEIDEIFQKYVEVILNDIDKQTIMKATLNTKTQLKGIILSRLTDLLKEVKEYDNHNIRHHYHIIYHNNQP